MKEKKNSSALMEHSLVRIKVSVADYWLITKASLLLSGTDEVEFNSWSPVWLGVDMY